MKPRKPRRCDALRWRCPLPAGIFAGAVEPEDGQDEGAANNGVSGLGRGGFACTDADAFQDQPWRDQMDRCFSQRRAAPSNNGIPDNILTKYCACTVGNLEQLVSSLTSDQVQRLSGLTFEQWPQELRVRVYQSGVDCFKGTVDRCRRLSSTQVSCP